MVKVNLENPFLARPKSVKIGRSYWQAQSKAPTILKQKDKWVKQQNDRNYKAFRNYLQTEGARALNKEVKDYLTTSNDNTWTNANRNPKNQHLQARVTKGAKAHASWEKEHPTLTKWGNVLGAAPFAVAAAPLAAAAGSGVVALGDAAAATAIGQGVTNFLAPIAGTSIAGASIPQWLDMGLTSIFGAHGLQTAINEGEISPTTALEIAPLGRLAKPIYNLGKEGLQYAGKGLDAATRYASPSYDLYRSIDENPIVKRSFPIKSLYRADVYRGGKIKNPRNISLTTDPKYAEQYGEVTPYLFESKSVAKAKEALMGYSDPVNNDMFIYHNTKDVPGANAIIGHDLVTGEFPYNSKGTEIISLSPNNIYPKRPKPSTIKWRDAVKTPKITSENASNITPEQWTAAQDAAIAKGDMTEAQRLRDLHFKVNTPGNVVVKEGNPTHNYHGTDNEFNTFDIDLFGQTDNGDRGRGFYFSEDKRVSKGYGPIIKDVYLYAKTPYKGFKKEKYLNRGKSKDEIVQYLTNLHRKNLEDNVRVMIKQQKSGSHSPMYDDLGITKDMSEQEIRNLVNKAYNRENIIPNEVGNLDEADIFLSPYENVVYKPNQIKLADAVTYDNKGVRIPLGKRDNFKLNDIRYGVLPFGVGLTGYGLFNNKKALGGSIPFYNPKRNIKI